MWCYLVPVLVANPWRSKVVCPNIVRYLHKPRRGRRPVDGWTKVVHWLRSRPHPPDCCARDRAGFAPRLLANQMAPSIVQSVKPHGSVTKFWFTKKEKRIVYLIHDAIPSIDRRWRVLDRRPHDRPASAAISAIRPLLGPWAFLFLKIRASIFSLIGCHTHVTTRIYCICFKI